MSGHPETTPAAGPDATEADAAPPRPSGDAGPRFGYHPALDGLRALAVISVMAFHASIWDKHYQWTGGWLGVDVFFVLSGFLITRLLLVEFERRQRIKLRSFYVRRVLRLYPLIALVLAFVVTNHYLKLGPAILRPTRAGISGIAFYYSNWVIVHAGSNKPLGTFSHLWTLSIEEQFYVVWPLVVLCLLLVGFRRRGIALVSAAGTAAVALYRYRIVWNAWHFGAHNPFTFGLRTRAHLDWYYSSFAHTDGLLIGAFLAAVLSFDARRPPQAVSRLLGVLAPIALAGDVFIAYRVGSGSSDYWLASWGLIVFNALAMLLVAHLVLSTSSLLTSSLALRPLVWIGRRSYGIYVFNLPILFYLQQHFHRRPEQVTVLGTVLTFALAGISYRWFEQPFLRLKSRFSTAA